MLTKDEFLAAYHDSEARVWFESRPLEVQEAILRYPPDCYRSRNNTGHYHIYSYDEPLDKGSITLKLVHGSDSFLPGVVVFGVPTDSVVRCGCGMWKHATEEQLMLTEERIKAERALFQKRRTR